MAPPSAGTPSGRCFAPTFTQSLLLLAGTTIAAFPVLAALDASRVLGLEPSASRVERL